MSDVFGRAGHVWLAELELPVDERETVDGCLRQIDYLETEIALVERGIAEHALGSAAIRRLNDRARREPDDRDDVHRRRRRHSPLRGSAQAGQLPRA